MHFRANQYFQYEASLIVLLFFIFCAVLSYCVDINISMEGDNFFDNEFPTMEQAGGPHINTIGVQNVVVCTKSLQVGGAR
jgi:Flp pilus assembly protein CpaB